MAVRLSVCLFVFLSRSFVFCNLKNTHTNWLNRLEHFVCILVLLVVNACIKEGINKNFDFAFAAVAVVFVVLNTRNYQFCKKMCLLFCCVFCSLYKYFGIISLLQLLLQLLLFLNNMLLARVLHANEFIKKNRHYRLTKTYFILNKSKTYAYKKGREKLCNFLEFLLKFNKQSLCNENLSISKPLFLAGVINFQRFKIHF